LKSISPDIIKEALSGSLPASEAHKLFLPPARSLEMSEETKRLVKHSAVMLLLVDNDDSLSLCLTRRNSHMKHHPGQISFPGGKMDEGENDYQETALRELEEETGIARHNINVCGSLSDLYIEVSNFLIHPVVGYINWMPNFNINPDEVDEVFLVPLTSFFNENNISKERISTHFGTIDTPAYLIDGKVIWGATAMIIAEFTMQLTTFFLHRG